VRRDCLERKRSAEHWEEFVAELEPEREAASSALDQLRTQAAATRNEATLRDAEEEALAALQSSREALAGLVTGAADVDAARRALRQSSSHSCCIGRRRLRDSSRRRPRRWRLVHRATVRADAILSPLVIGRDDHDEPTVEQALELRRVSVSSGEELRASPRRTSQFFGVIRPLPR
jgi:hypothetical protein